MTVAARIAMISLAVGLANAACIGLEPAPSGGTPVRGTPTATPTIGPSATPTPPPPTSTPTSTVTPTGTPTPTPTNTPVIVIGPDGRPVVSPPPFATNPDPFVPPASGGGAAPAAPAAPAPAPPDASPVWGCDGDERMEFLPPNPVVGEKTFVFVTGSRNRQFGLIIGPNLSGVQGADVAGGSGLRKRWEFTPTRPGEFTYHFYGGPYPEHLCVSGVVTVAAPGGAASAPRPAATSTPIRPPLITGSPRPDH